MSDEIQDNRTVEEMYGLWGPIAKARASEIACDIRTSWIVEIWYSLTGWVRYDGPLVCKDAYEFESEAQMKACEIASRTGCPMRVTEVSVTMTWTPRVLIEPTTTLLSTELNRGGE